MIRYTLAPLAAAVLCMGISGAGASQQNPAKAKECRGEVAKMAAMGIVQRTEQIGEKTLLVTVEPIRWRAMPDALKAGIGRTLGCVLAVGESLETAGTTITFQTADQTVVHELVGNDLVAR